MLGRRGLNNETIKSSKLLLGIGLVVLPLILLAVYMLGVKIHETFRYDESFFTPEYQDVYFTPGSVAIELEQALRSGDSGKIAELTGIRSSTIASESRPNIVLSILMDVDERDYFHYMYFDISTYLRETHYIKQVNGRWVVSPQDAYFYYDSGQWVKVFGPIASVWWAILLVIGIGNLVSKAASRTRAAYGS
jgi:hypothetical protein